VQDTPAAHGTPFGAEEIARTKEILGLPADQSFWVPDAVLDFNRSKVNQTASVRAAWEQRLEAISVDTRRSWDASQAGGGLSGWSDKLPTFEPGTQLATRRALKQCIDATASGLPSLFPGSADLTENTGVELAGSEIQSSASPAGNQVHYGIREHAMGSIMNGLALHKGVLPVGGTFFIFSDYMRPAVRLAALSDAHVIYSWTHDSVGLGEDGPTHQPVEQLAALRAVPNLRLIRPADANECAHAWRIAVDSTGPTALVLSRQNLPVLSGTAGSFDGVSKGAYVLVEAAGSPGSEPDIVIVGTGSEVQLCVAAEEILRQGPSPKRARVVSLPSWELFADQDDDYRRSVFPPGVPVLAVEAASPFGWERYSDDIIGIDHFGASAPGPTVLANFGFTPDNVAVRALALITTRE
jgi:transketolase